MKKRHILTFIIGVALIPINVQALSGNVTLKCDKTKLKANEETICSIKANTDGEVSGVGANLTVGNNLSINSINIDTIWQGSGEDGNIQLYTDNNQKGNFNIATFKLKAGDISTGLNTKVSLTDVKLVKGGDFEEVSFDASSIDIRILSEINSLKTLTVSGADFSFNKNTKTYELTIDSKNTTISATKEDSNSSISGDIGTKNLNYGLNTFIIKATSESGSVNTYTIKINRPDNRSKENYLLEFNFNNNIDFSKDKTNYNLVIENSVTKLASCYGKVTDNTILCINSENIKYSDKATLKVLYNNNNIDDLISKDKTNYKCNGDKTICYLSLGDINIGNNELKLTIIAENESTKDYTFKISRKNANGQVVDKTNEEITSNVKTGSNYIIIIPIIIAISIIITLITLKKGNIFNKDKVERGQNDE